MVIYGIYVVSKSGGLIFNLDNVVPKVENEKTFSYPLDIRLKYENKKIIVEFGQRDGIHGKYTPKLIKLLTHTTILQWVMFCTQ